MAAPRRKVNAFFSVPADARIIGHDTRQDLFGNLRVIQKTNMAAIFSNHPQFNMYENFKQRPGFGYVNPGAGRTGRTRPQPIAYRGRKSGKRCKRRRRYGIGSRLKSLYHKFKPHVKAQLKKHGPKVRDILVGAAKQGALSFLHGSGTAKERARTAGLGAKNLAQEQLKG